MYKEIAKKILPGQPITLSSMLNAGVANEFLDISQGKIKYPFIVGGYLEKYAEKYPYRIFTHRDLFEYKNGVIRRKVGTRYDHPMFIASNSGGIHEFDKLIREYPDLPLSKIKDAVIVEFQAWADETISLLPDPKMSSKTIWEVAEKHNEYISSVYIHVEDPTVILTIHANGLYLNDEKVSDHSDVPFQKEYAAFDHEAGGYCRISFEHGYRGYDTLWQWTGRGD